MVELIITVVILAIIIAVAIAGITSNIKKARINTDINNASTIQKAISTLSLDKELIDKFSTIEEGTKLAIKWEDAQSIKDSVLTPSDSKSEQALVDERIPSELINKIQGLLPDGLPASQTGEPFYIVIEKGSGNEISYKTISLAGNSSEGSNGGSSSNSGSTSIPPIIESHTHEIIITKDVKPTCTEEGQKVSKCNKCDYTTTEIIEPLGHDFTTFVSKIDPTCTEQGTTINKCVRCEEQDTKYTKALGHDYSTTYTIDKQATCTEDGSKSQHCTRCSVTQNVTTIAKTAHTSTNGGTASIHTKCSVCNTTLSTTHSYTKTTQTAATCTTKGTSKYTCSCGYSYTIQDIPLAAHNYSSSYTVDKAATCTTAGSQSKHCTRCNATTGSVSIPATGHEYSSSYTVDTPATCSSPGSKSKHCIHSGCTATTGSVSIKATGNHNYSGCYYTISYPSWNDPEELYYICTSSKCSNCNKYSSGSCTGPFHSMSETQAKLKEYFPGAIPRT